MYCDAIDNYCLQHAEEVGNYRFGFVSMNSEIKLIASGKLTSALALYWPSGSPSSFIYQNFERC